MALTTIALDPATLPDEPLPDDHPAYLVPLAAPSYATERERAQFITAADALTPQQTRFVQAMLALSPRSTVKAALLAGYSPKAAHKTGYRLLKSPHVGKVWALLNGDNLPAPILAIGEARPPCTREEVTQFLSEVIRGTPEEYLRCLADLAAGRTTPATTSRIYSSLERKRFVNSKGVTRTQDTLKIVDKMAAAKLLADLMAWRVDPGKLEGTQAVLDDIMDAINGRPANK